MVGVAWVLRGGMLGVLKGNLALIAALVEARIEGGFYAKDDWRG